MLPGGCIPFAFPGLPQVGCAFGTIHAGNMALLSQEREKTIANRRRLMAGLGITAWADFYQTHGVEFVLNPAPVPPDSLPPVQADGGGTRQKGLALIIKTADCQPILFADKAGTAIGAMHAGWRGNAAGYPGIGLARFCEAYDISPENVLAVRGPSLGPAAAEFTNFENEWPPEFRPWFDESRKTMDLWSLLRHQLVEAGMRPEHVFSLDLCTWSLPELFFSHRRGHDGRQISAIWLKDI